MRPTISKLRRTEFTFPRVNHFGGGPSVTNSHTISHLKLSTDVGQLTNVVGFNRFYSTIVIFSWALIYPHEQGHAFLTIVYHPPTTMSPLDFDLFIETWSSIYLPLHFRIILQIYYLFYLFLAFPTLYSSTCLYAAYVAIFPVFRSFPFVWQDL